MKCFLALLLVINISCNIVFVKKRQNIQPKDFRLYREESKVFDSSSMFTNGLFFFKENQDSLILELSFLRFYSDGRVFKSLNIAQLKEEYLLGDTSSENGVLGYYTLIENDSIIKVETYEFNGFFKYLYYTIQPDSTLRFSKSRLKFSIFANKENTIYEYIAD